MASSFKKDPRSLDLITDIDMLLMVEKCVRRGICNSIYLYAKANNKYMKDYDKNKEPPCLQYWDVNNLYGWTISQRLPVNNFEWIKRYFSTWARFHKKNIMKEVIKDILLKLKFNILKNYMNIIMI